jgi:predicted DNA-binding transcriptional regulator YafY
MVQVARAWRPEFSKSPAPLDLVVATNENYADLLVRQYPDALAANKKDGRVEVGLSFDSPRAALRFILDAADRVRLESPKSLKNELAAWLKNVNRTKGAHFGEMKFDGPATNDVLGQTLQLLHAVYVADDGLRISELATRFSLAPSHVRLIMDRLVSLEPMVGSTDGSGAFPAHVIKDCDDWDDEANDDSTYRADFSDLPEGADEPSPYMWRDLFELNIALREASRLYRDPAIFSAIEKIEEATSSYVEVEMTTNETLLGDVMHAVNDELQIKILYTSGADGESGLRAIEPREMKVLNGHTYVRAYCLTRETWRTFRVDRINAIVATSPVTEIRPIDGVTNWLTQVGEEGEEVVVVVESYLPNAQWLALADGRHAVKFRLSHLAFLDHLMLCAGAGAVVATTKYAKAGHDLAKRIAAQL